MKIPFVDLHAQYLSIKAEIDSAIAEVIAESAFIRGRHVDAFERAWAEALKVKHCVSCANGTDALYIVMRGLDIKSGDEVITTAHSWIATTETITQAGGRVVFCDTREDTFNIDPRLIEAKITRATVGIIPVHLCGQPADMIPAGTKIRRNFSFWPGEKNWLNRSYRCVVDCWLARRYRLADYFFDLTQSIRDNKVDRVMALAATSKVELMTHPVVESESNYLMSDQFQTMLEHLNVGSYALV